MKNVKSISIALVTISALASVSFSSLAMDKHIEKSLIEVCMSAQSNKVYRFKNTAKAVHLKEKTIALKVMCNGDDIIAFAEKHGADKTAARLQNTIQGNVSITDVAALSKINVIF